MKRILLALVLLLSTSITRAGEQQFASFDRCGPIPDCRVGYRVDGTLNESKSNVVVLTTWFGGTTGDLAGWVGPGKLFDTDRWYVISIDAFGDGVSSSPSNHSAMPGFGMRDMVDAQHKLLTETLGLEHVHAVAGLSMGGMQAFEWIVRHPEFMTKAIPIVGTPWQTSADLIFWGTQLDLLESFRDSPEAMRKAMRAAAGMNTLELWTPAYLVRTVKPEDAAAYLEKRRESVGRLDPWNYMSQLRAMIGHDIGRDLKNVRAQLLIVVAEEDQTVNPGPSREIAKTLGARLVTLKGDCGHLATTCDREVLVREVAEFLNN